MKQLNPKRCVCFPMMKVLSLGLCLILSTTGANSPRGPFATWTFLSPNARMEWNALPEVEIEVQLRNSSCMQQLQHEPFDLVVYPATNDTVSIADSNVASAMSTAAASPLLTSPGTSTVLEMRKTESNATQIVMAMIIESKDEDSSASKVGGATAALVEKYNTTCIILPTSCDADFVHEFVLGFWNALYKDERFRSSPRKESVKKQLKVVLPCLPCDSHDDPQEVDEEMRCKIDSVDEQNESKQQPPEAQKLENAIDTLELEAALTNSVKYATSIARGMYLTRDIVNAPHNVLNAIGLADTASRLAKEESCLTCHVLTESECEARGMGAYLGVARGAETPPRFIHLTYTPPRRKWGQRSKKQLKQLAIVGKGLLMDTGGYSIKTQNMEYMKFDCGGAAAVLGAARAIAALQPENVQVHFVIAATENMINERAYVPGDILIASNGKTIEVLNTDAEGRLTLADALVFADQELKCEEIVELSTLTGACMVSLGGSIAGLWSKSDSLVQDLLTASKSVGEKLWRMPLESEYNDAIKSKIADIKNIGDGRYGGAIHAALFLQHFVSEGKPFAHIDMAGPVWNFKAGQASGWGVKLLTEWVRNTARSNE